MKSRHTEPEDELKKRKKPDEAASDSSRAPEQRPPDLRALQETLGNAGIERLMTEGRPLDPAARSRMEQAFGADFGRVRLHEGAPVDSEFGARAVTVGEDIYLAPGQSEGDQRLLGHELAHVVQQRGATETAPMTVPGDATERVASEAAAAVIVGNAAPMLAPAGRGPARDGPVTRVDFTEEEAREPVPTLAEDIGDYLHALQVFFQGTRDSYQEACLAFGNTMFHETSATAEPDVVGAVLKKGIGVAFSQLTAWVGTAIPGLSGYATGVGVVVELATAAYEEIERAKAAATEARLVEFINSAVLGVGNRLQAISEDLATNRDRYRNALLAEASGQEELLGGTLRVITRGLRAPRNREVLQELYDAWMRESRRTSAGALGTIYSTGVLHVTYEIDEEEGTAEQSDVVLAAPLAAQVKAGLRDAWGDVVNLDQLGFDKIIRVENEHDWDLHFGRGPIHRDVDDPWHYFSRFVRTLPNFGRIYVSDISTEEEVITG